MNIQTTKLELIKIITNLQDESLLTNIYLFVKRIIGPKKSVPPKETPTKDKELEELLAIGRTPMPEKLDLEELKREQNYDSKKLGIFLDNLDRSIWEGENQDELLQLLRK